MKLNVLALILVSSCIYAMPVLAEDPVRKTELARIDKEAKAQKKEAEAEAADLLPQQKKLRDQVAQKEKTLRDLARRRRTTGPTSRALEKLQAELQELENQIKDRQSPYEEKLVQLEQERRRILKRFPEPGDPTYLEVESKLFTQEEWDQEKTKCPRTVADEYVQELLRRGIIRSAKYTEATRHAQSMDTTRDGSPIRDFMNINYTVQYVSKGGILNERNAWVTVITLDSKHWTVSPMMQGFEILGGLP